MTSGIVEMDELCALLSQSWPEAGSTGDGTNGSSPSTGDERLELTPGDDFLPGASAQAATTEFDFDSVPLAFPLAESSVPVNAFIVKPVSLPSGQELLVPTGAVAPASREQPRRFSEAAMRVLMSCEQLLTSDDGEVSMVENVLHEIAALKKRYSSRSATSPSRCSISRQRRYSLGADARTVLKTWVDAHLDDPYPSVAEKQQLAQRASLSMKQVNDWFTNYRKRHWEDEMLGARASP